MTREHFREPLDLARLWIHECERVLSDRLVNATDLGRFSEFRANATKKHFDDIKQARRCCLAHRMQGKDRQHLINWRHLHVSERAWRGRRTWRHSPCCMAASW